MKKLFRGCKMLNLAIGDAGKPFAAGEVAMHFLSTSAVGAIERAKGDFYANNPNKHTAVRQAGLLRDWIACPGDNGLAITQVIYDQIESIVTGDSDDMAALQEEMVEEVSSMLP